MKGVAAMMLAGILPFAIACAMEHGYHKPLGTQECRGDAGKVWVAYVATDYDDGSVLATCEVYRDDLSASSTRLYIPGDKGVFTGECRARFDIDEPSNGTWAFSRKDGRVGVCYIDKDSRFGGFKMELTDCEQRGNDD